MQRTAPDRSSDFHLNLITKAKICCFFQVLVRLNSFTLVKKYVGGDASSDISLMVSRKVFDGLPEGPEASNDHTIVKARTNKVR